MPHRGLRLGRRSTVLVATFNGTSAHQVGEGEMQGPLRGEVGLSQGPHTLAHLQKQFGALSAHSPSPGELQAVEERARKERDDGRVGLESLSSQLCPSVPTSSITTSQAPRSQNNPLLNPGQRTQGLSIPGEPSTEAQAHISSLLHALFSSSGHQTRA